MTTPSRNALREQFPGAYFQPMMDPEPSRYTPGPDECDTYAQKVDDLQDGICTSCRKKLD